MDTTAWVTNGPVLTVARDGGTIYIGGSFTQVGPATGSGVPIDGTSGAPLGGFPKVVGTIRAVAKDGSGGWYIGGSFTLVGGLARLNLAHILSDGSVSSWSPNANALVHALAVHDDTVYVGGNFGYIGGQLRNRLAALDPTTGLAYPWNPDADGDVWTLSIGPNVVYAGGSFSNVGGGMRSRLAALDRASGLATPWNPGASGTVYTLAVSGGTIYAGGNFTTIGGQPRNRIAALDAAADTATSWNPGASASVTALAVSGGTVYTGGGFTVISGQTRRFIAALDSASGVATPWDPNANGPIDVLSVSGSTVYAGGNFTAIGGETRSGVAALDATSGLAAPWNPNANKRVYVLALNQGTVYVGGDFTSLGGLTRNNIAALDAGTGVPTAWDPNCDGLVGALIVREHVVYAGGLFVTVGGQTRRCLAALDPGTGLATGWDPELDGRVWCLAANDNAVYAGGQFTTIGGQPRSYIGAVDHASGLASSWDPSADGFVYALAVSGSTAYVGGTFTHIGGQPRDYIAAVGLEGGLVTDWDPDASAAVQALVVHDSVVYAGGEFSDFHGQPRIFVGALDASSGLPTSWNPGANSVVSALAVSGNMVYAGGSFGVIGGQPRDGIAALDAESGLAAPWNPSANGSVEAFEVTGDKVYAGGYFAQMGIHPQSGIAVIAAPPAVSAILPAHGGDGGQLSVAVSGSGFSSGLAIRLARAGEPDRPGTGVIVAPDGTSLTAIFDLTGATTGLWDVVVTTPDLQSATLSDGFTVVPAAPHLLRVDVLAPALMRPNRRKAFDLVIENLSNNDAIAVPLWVSRIPSSATVELGFPLTAPPQAGGEPDWTQAPLTFEAPSGRYLVLVIPRIPPGTVVRRVYLTVPETLPEFDLDAALTPPWVDGPVFQSCLGGGGVLINPPCAGLQMSIINESLACTPGIEALSGSGLWAKIAWQCEGASSLPAALAKAEQVLDFMLQPIEGPGMPGGCEITLQPQWQDRRHVLIVTSVDPNDKLGVGGHGPERQIGGGQILPYSIRFENLETATAPAQLVQVLDVLDGAVFDLNSVSLSAITFGSHEVYPPPGLSSYATDVDLRPEQSLIVRVGASLDHATGILSWSLVSLDPATMQPPEDPLVGFLPPNVSPPEGEGSLLFTVMLRSDLASGAEIRNRAGIGFDQNPPFETPEWMNTLDITSPESAVLPLAEFQDSVSFTVRWATVGEHPDLHDYSVYVSQDGGAFLPWRLHTVATADTFSGPGGHSYAFYSLACDSSGNLESVPEVPDAMTFSRVAVDGPVRPAFALHGAVPNPAIDGLRIAFTLSSRERAVLEVIDIAGRRLLRRDVGQLGAGRHAVDVSHSIPAAGLYFIRLQQGNHVQWRRAVAIR